MHPTDLDPNLFDWILLTYLIAVVPILGVREVRSLRERLAAGDRDARIRAYRLTLVAEWAAAAPLVVVWSLLSRPVADLGLGFPLDVRALLAWGLSMAVVLVLAFQVRSVAGSESVRETFREQLGDLAVLMPRSRRELRWFSALSVIAGICEELIYRGFLMALLWSLGGPVLAVVGSTIVFTLGHAYQPRELPRVAGVGLVTALLYWLGGTLLPLIVLHGAIDLSSGWMSWRVAEDDDSEAPERDGPEAR